MRGNNKQCHVGNVFDKTGIVNRAQAGAWAREHGLA
jgi:DNA-binding CsgD family transcriptional regulator